MNHGDEAYMSQGEKYARRVGYRWEYFKTTVRRTFHDWDWGERLVALILVIVSAVGYMGFWADWW